MKKLLITIHALMTLVMFSLTGLANTNSSTLPSYDNIPITPDTWEKVVLTYKDKIDGKQYPGEINLLRPKHWLARKKKEERQCKLCPSDKFIHLSIPEFGIPDICTKVASSDRITLDTSHMDWSKQHVRPVIGTFMRYASIVNTYNFKDRYGKITHIHATPNHPFYVKNKDDFIPIKDISPKDNLVTEKGELVKLTHCLKDKYNHYHCGKQYNVNGSPVPVYNIEVYQKHVYYVGKDKILVHNIYEYDQFLRANIEPVVDDTEFQLRLAKSITGGNVEESFIEEASCSTGFCINQTVKVDQELHGESITGLVNRNTNELENSYYQRFQYDVKNSLEDMHTKINEYPDTSTFIVTAEPKDINTNGHVLNAIKLRGKIRYINVFEDGSEGAFGLERLQTDSRFTKYDGQWGYYYTGVVGIPRPLP